VTRFHDIGECYGQERRAEATLHGHTAMCNYLHSEDPHSYGVEACHEAARGGHADTLRWLRRHYYDWDEESIAYYAAEGGSVKVMQYLQQEGFGLDDSNGHLLTELLNIAGAHNKLAVAQWLREQGAEWPAVLRYTTQHEDAPWRGDTLAWARAEGCTAPTTYDD
jgi:Ankyrin repeats (3 copies)